MKILVVRRDPFATGGEQLVAVYAATFPRKMLADVNWGNIKPANLLDAADEWLLNLKGQADEVAALDLRDEPDLQVILERLADILSIPPFRPNRSRTSTGVRGWEAKRSAPPISGRSSQGADRRSATNTPAGPSDARDIGRTDVMAFIDLEDHLDRSMLPMIEQRLQDPDPLVRRRALDYYLKLNGPDPAGQILAALEDPDESVRVMAFIDLEDHLDRSMLPMIEQRLQDPDPLVRRPIPSSGAARWTIEGGLLAAERLLQRAVWAA